MQSTQCFIAFPIQSIFVSLIDTYYIAVNKGIINVNIE